MFILRRILFYFHLFHFILTRKPGNQDGLYKITQEDFRFYTIYVDDFIFFDILFLINIIWFHGHNKNGFKEMH